MFLNLLNLCRCWSPDPEKRPSMDEIVDEMQHLLQFFPGGTTPLVFPAFSDNDSSLASSGTSSSYDLTNTDRLVRIFRHMFQ